MIEFPTGQNPTKHGDLSRCKLCPNLGASHVPSDGPASADLMVVGSAPSEKELKALQPFLDESGDLLKYLLDEVYLDRDQVYITNALKCHPPGDRIPTAEEAGACVGNWLSLEMEIVNPKVVLILGEQAYYAIVPPGQLPFAHGNIIKTALRSYLITFHPAHWLRSRSIEPFLKLGPKLQELLETAAEAK